MLASIYRFDISWSATSFGSCSADPKPPTLESARAELAVLGLLSEQPLHGYELKKRLSETLGPLWGISFGSLLSGAAPPRSAAGAIEEVDSRHELDRRRRRPDRLARRATSPRPASRRRRCPAGAPARRTASPRRASSCSPSCSPTRRADDERSFALKLSFCRHLDRRRPARVLERRRAQLTQRLAKTRAHARDPHASIATPGRSSSTGPSPPSTTSHGSTS